MLHCLADDEMSRLTDNDSRFGPLTYGRSSWSPLRLVFSTGGDYDDREPFNSLTAYAFGWVARLKLPTMMRPCRIQHVSTIQGRDFWYETFPCEYGFSLSDGFLQLFLGPQTHDSDTTKSWSKHLPWTQWRFYRHAYYDLEGSQVWEQLDRDRKRPFVAHGFDEQQRAEEACQSDSFLIDDYDGQRIIAKTIIEQREWKFGEGWFKWLSIFRKNLVRRSLKIDFDSETGPEKGSWKGGTCGTNIDMLPDELHEAAFKRYCEGEHRSKYTNYRVKYIGRTP